MKKKLLTGGLVVALALGSVQSASALFLGCGTTTTYDMSLCGSLGVKIPHTHTFIFGFEIGSPTTDDAVAC